MDSSFRLPMVLLAGFLLACVLFGGSSQPENLSLLVIRPIAVVYIVVTLVLPVTRDWTGLRWPLALLSAFAATFVLQLIPFPPALWTALPGHARFLEATAALNMPPPWRPISVSPELTFNSLLDLLIPLAILTGMATIPAERRVTLVPVLLAAMLASAVLGIAQWAGSAGSSLYFYRYTSRDLPVGFFANRNHQALFLAMSFPLLRVWADLPGRLVLNPAVRGVMAIAAALFILPVLLASGSRSGLVLAALGGLTAFFITPWPTGRTTASSQLWRMGPIALGGGGLIVIVSAVIFFGRALSVSRITQIDQIQSDLRVRYLPIIMDMTRDFMPFGTGYGTFDAMFRIYEPFWALNPKYFNHAHNDILELAMTGGAPAIAVLCTAIVFFVGRVTTIFREGWWLRPGVGAKGGMALIVLMFAASITDYPLRAPAISMVFTIAVAWLALPLSVSRPQWQRNGSYDEKLPTG